jgi:hypothetical protein
VDLYIFDIMYNIMDICYFLRRVLRFFGDSGSKSLGVFTVLPENVLRTGFGPGTGLEARAWSLAVRVTTSTAGTAVVVVGGTTAPRGDSPDAFFLCLNKAAAPTPALIVASSPFTVTGVVAEPLKRAPCDCTCVIVDGGVTVVDSFASSASLLRGGVPQAAKTVKAKVFKLVALFVPYASSVT